MVEESNKNLPETLNSPIQIKEISNWRGGSLQGTGNFELKGGCVQGTPVMWESGREWTWWYRDRMIRLSPHGASELSVNSIAKTDYYVWVIAHPNHERVSNCHSWGCWMSTNFESEVWWRNHEHVRDNVRWSWPVNMSAKLLKYRLKCERALSAYLKLPLWCVELLQHTKCRCNTNVIGAHFGHIRDIYSHVFKIGNATSIIVRAQRNALWIPKRASSK